MGRRALRKIDPRLDLSRHLREADDLPATLDAEALFGRVASLEIEVGSGKGLFLAGAARANPQRDYLGIEVAQKYARYAAAKLARQKATNAVMIRGDGLALFRQWFPPASLSAVHVYFPDPWWKKRHKKRRVLNEDFLRDVQRTLVAGGRLHSGPTWKSISNDAAAHRRHRATGRAAAGGRIARRARPGLSHAFRAPHAAKFAAGASGRVCQVVALYLRGSSRR
jgi:tRNA (guanine-N7-)-methyltransferase